MKAVRIKVIGPEKTHSAKSMQINDRMENFVIFNMGNECENSDSKYFNLGKLSFTKLLQSPTYSKTERRKKDNTPHKIRSSQVYRREAMQTRKRHKTTNPDELSENELFGQANRLEAKLLSVESIK